MVMAIQQIVQSFWLEKSTDDNEKLQILKIWQNIKEVNMNIPRIRKIVVSKLYQRANR